MQDYIDAGIDHPMPDDVPDCDMLELFSQSGFISNAGFGPTALTWPDIAAFSQINGLNSSEAQTLRSMSENYLKYYTLGENPLCIPPWEADDD